MIACVQRFCHPRIRIRFRFDLFHPRIKINFHGNNCTWLVKPIEDPGVRVRYNMSNARNL